MVSGRAEVQVVDCVCVSVEAAATVGSRQAGGASHRTLKGAREGGSLQEIGLNRKKEMSCEDRVAPIL